MKTLKKVFISSLVALVSVSLLNLNVSGQAQPKPWDVPANFKTMKNPVAKGDASNKAGLALYTKNCASCHGKTGLGDGVKARMLKEFPGDFSGAFYQNQTDGEHFYKTKTGRGEMPKYEGKLSDDEIWNIVNYMRTFKK
ncbi:MAG TPA: cytochrome C [Bacteroidales bacterium]|jgi:mono/diheme cytochrome c family protein|nr:cytochrome C [Bacteroidales bacterium]HBZ20621.1 cytochrome C [Bacteroidales bacterium]